MWDGSKYASVRPQEQMSLGDAALEGMQITGNNMIDSTAGLLEGLQVMAEKITSHPIDNFTSGLGVLEQRRQHFNQKFVDNVAQYGWGVFGNIYDNTTSVLSDPNNASKVASEIAVQFGLLPLVAEGASIAISTAMKNPYMGTFMADETAALSTSAEGRALILAERQAAAEAAQALSKGHEAFVAGAARSNSNAAKAKMGSLSDDGFGKPYGSSAPNAELQAARQRIAGQVEEVARRRSLGVDPASGRYRLAEEQAALRLEQQTGRQMRRDPSGTGDWLDAAGRTYDAVGPVPVGRFNLGSFTRQIDKHLLKQGLDHVVVDVAGLSATERAAVMSHIGNLTPAQQARIIVQPR